jgi:hypothetical protein
MDTKNQKSNILHNSQKTSPSQPPRSHSSHSSPHSFKISAPNILIHFKALSYDLEKLSEEITFIHLQHLLTAPFPTLYRTNLQNYELFKLNHTLPARFLQYSTKPWLILASYEFLGNVLSLYKTLFIGTKQLLYDTSRGSMYWECVGEGGNENGETGVLERNAILSRLLGSLLGGNNGDDVKFDDLFNNNLNRNPHFILEAILNLKKKLQKSVEKIHNFSQLFQFLYIKLNSLGISLPISYYHLILMSFLPAINVGNESLFEKFGKNDEFFQKFGNKLNFENNNQNNDKKLISKNVGNKYTQSDPIPSNYIEHILNTSIDYICTTFGGCVDNEDHNFGQNNNKNNEKKEEKNQPRSSHHNIHNSPHNPSQSLGNGIKIPFGTIIELQMMIYAFRNSNIFSATKNNKNKNRTKQPEALSKCDILEEIVEFNRFGMGEYRDNQVVGDHVMGDEEQNEKIEKNVSFKNVIKIQKNELCLKFCDFVNISLFPAFKSNDLTHSSSLYPLDEIISLFHPSIKGNFDQNNDQNNDQTNDQNARGNNYEPLDFTNFSLTLPGNVQFISQFANEANSTKKATEIKRDISIFLPEGSHSIISTIKQGKLLKKSLLSHLYENYEDVYMDFIKDGVDINGNVAKGRFDNYQNANLMKNLNKQINNTSFSDTDLVASIEPNDFIDLLFPRDILNDVENDIERARSEYIPNISTDLFFEQTQNNAKFQHNISPSQTSPNPNNPHQTATNTTARRYNLYSPTIPSFSILGEFFSTIIDKISSNLYFTILSIFKFFHLHLSLSHFLYLYLAHSLPNLSPTIYPTGSMIMNWFNGYKIQYNLFVNKRKLSFVLSGVPIDLRYQNLAEMSSNLLLNHTNFKIELGYHGGDGGDIVNGFKNNSDLEKLHFFRITYPNTLIIKAPHLINHIILTLHYKTLSYSIFPFNIPTVKGNKFLQRNENFKLNLNFNQIPPPHLSPSYLSSQFHKNLPTITMNILTSLLLTQFSDLFSTNQHLLLSEFFSTVELNSLNLNTFQLTQNQKVLLSKVIHLPSVEVNLVNSFCYYGGGNGGGVKQGDHTTIDDNQNEKENIQIEQNDIKMTENKTNDLLKFSFSFPKQFPSFYTRGSTRDRIYHTLEKFSHEFIYPLIFDSNEKSSQKLKNEKKNEENLDLIFSQNNSLSQYIFKLQDMLYIKALSVPWLMDVSFDNTTGFNKCIQDVNSRNILKQNYEKKNQQIEQNHENKQNKFENFSPNVLDDGQILQARSNKRQRQNDADLIPNIGYSNDNNSILSNPNDISPQNPILHTPSYDKNHNITPLLDDVLNRLQQHSKKAFFVTFLPLEMSVALFNSKSLISQDPSLDVIPKEPINQRGVKVEMQDDEFEGGNNLKNDTENKTDKFYPGNDLTNTIDPNTNEIMESYLSECYEPGLMQLVSSSKIQDQNAMKDDEKNEQKINEKNKSEKNLLEQGDVLIPYSSYLLYLSSLLETLCLIKSIPELLSNSDLINPEMNYDVEKKNNNNITTLNTSPSSSTTTIIIPPTDLLPSDSSSQYDIYSIPLLFPNSQSNLFGAFSDKFSSPLFDQNFNQNSSPKMNSQKNSALSPPKDQNNNSRCTPDIQSVSPIPNHKPEILALFNHSKKLNDSQSVQRSQEPIPSSTRYPNPIPSQIPPIQPPLSSPPLLNPIPTIRVHLANYSHSIYRATVTALLHNYWGLFGLLTLRNPLHLFNLNPLFFDGGKIAMKLNQIESLSRKDRISTDMIGHHLLPSQAPECPRCKSNLFIFSFTLSQGISSTKSDIYGGGDGDNIVEKYTCRNTQVGCGYSWIVRS